MGAIERLLGVRRLVGALLPREARLLGELLRSAHRKSADKSAYSREAQPSTVF